MRRTQMEADVGGSVSALGHLPLAPPLDWCFPPGSDLTISPAAPSTTDMYSKANVTLSGAAAYAGCTLSHSLIAVRSFAV